MVCRDSRGLGAIISQDESAIALAYLAGSLDFEGDMLELFRLRGSLKDRHPLSRFFHVRMRSFLFGQIKSDRKWIAQHYDYEQDFYLLFLDKSVRAYSQAIFLDDDELLEPAMERKMEFAMEACRIRPGDRVLDIGGGWGSFVEYAGSRGARVVSLTLSGESENFIKRIIAERNLSCTVHREHFFEHQAEKPYDAIVNMGVTEHLPDYERTIQQYARLIKPGGRVYLDASACRAKHNFSSFIYRYVYPGNPSPMCLHDYLKELSCSMFELKELHNDRKSYYLTALWWVKNLERSRHEIVRRWGEPLFRKFQLYLWGTVHAFKHDIMCAYRLVLEYPETQEGLERWSAKRWL